MYSLSDIYKFNKYTGKYYKYSISEYNTYADMFNEFLHNNDIEPGFIDNHTCGYCKTSFNSRNQLFYHLGFMNIDISKKYKARYKKRKYRIVKKKKTQSKSQKTIDMIVESFAKKVSVCDV
jgi:hypothetical protein